MGPVLGHLCVSCRVLFPSEGSWGQRFGSQPPQMGPRCSVARAASSVSEQLVGTASGVWAFGERLPEHGKRRTLHLSLFLPSPSPAPCSSLSLSPSLLHLKAPLAGRGPPSPQVDPSASECLFLSSLSLFFFPSSSPSLPSPFPLPFLLLPPLLSFWNLSLHWSFVCFSGHEPPSAPSPPPPQLFPVSCLTTLSCPLHP